MRETIRLFVRDLELIRTVEKNRGMNISGLARLLSIPYSTAYVKVHKLERAGLLTLKYESGKKSIYLTKTAEELIEALEIIEKKEKFNSLSSVQQPLDNTLSGISQEHHL
jgi:predicted transcriptional regulator